MGKLRTQEQLEAIFQKIRERKQREKETLKRKIKTVGHKKKHKPNINKEQEEKALKRLEKHLYRSQRTIIVYHSRYVDRFQADDEVYLTREELMEAEKRGEGKIQWDVWDKLIEETKRDFK